MSTQLLSIALILLTVAATPGPNNFIVLRQSASGGLVAAIPAVVGVVLGTMLLLVIAWSGVSQVFLAHSATRIGFALLGAAYLMWLGISLLVPNSPRQNATGSMASGAVAMIIFQILNPKGWLLVTAVSAAALSAPTAIPFPTIAALTAGVSAICLLGWAVLGVSASSVIAGPARRRRFEQLLGLALISSAPLLLVY